MNIPKQDALYWFTFFAALPEGEELSPRQEEIVWAVLKQIEDSVEGQNNELLHAIPGLQSLRNRTYYVGPAKKFSKGCASCLTGTGLTAIRKTNVCNLRCTFCYDYGEMDNIPPIGKGAWDIGGTRFYTEDIDLLLSTQPHPTGVSYVYLEPFMEIEEYYPIIGKFKQAGIHQHMYTNGTLATEDNLKALGEAGLDELRFNLGASECADKVIAAMATAKKYIPTVGIETPMTPSFYACFQQKKQQILDTGIDLMNCAELHLNPNNIANYQGENMYMSRRGYISPVWSRQLTLKLMRQAAEENWPIAMHDCANRTKFARDLNLKAKEGGWFGASAYGSEFDTLPYEYFLPILRDESFHFLKEKPMPKGYRLEDGVL